MEQKHQISKALQATSVKMIQQLSQAGKTTWIEISTAPINDYKRKTASYIDDHFELKSVP